MKRKLWATALAAGLGTLGSATTFGLTAFPGADGFGAGSTGGRGGSVYVVTNLNDSGAGSFRDAVSQSNRIVVFAVGGYVNLASAVSVASNITILGQTAPGQGIGFEGHEVSLSESSNDIVQFIRAREGSADTSAKASINIGDCTNTILDHVSAEYSQYDNIDAVGNNSALANVTVQNSIIADGIKAQQFNMHTEGVNVSYLDNVWANAHGRSALSKANDQFVNNVIYDYGYAYTSGNTAGFHTHDVIGNYFIAGPSTTSAGDAWYQLSTNDSIYASGNMLDSSKDGTLNGSSSAPGGVTNLTSAWSPVTATLPILSATAAYAFDIAHAGDSLSLDTVDTQIISQVQSLGTAGSIYNTNADTGLSNGGFGVINGGTAPTDSDGDGIPDAWERSHGLNPVVADSTKLNALGYTMIEQYAQQLGDEYASQTWSASGGNWVTATGNWSVAVPGDFDHALIRGNGTTNGSATITGGNTAIAFSISIGGNGPAAGESLIVNGGSLTVYDTIYVGDQNNGTLQISGGLVRANNVQLGNTVWAVDGSSSTTYTGSLILNGGVLSTGQVVLGGGSPGSWTTGGSISWSGGTLQAYGNLNVNAPAMLGRGGGILDTNGNAATLSGVLSGAGSFTKIGAGALSLTAANTYTGVTTISAGSIIINSLVNGGSAGELGASSNLAGNLVLDGGTLRFAGTTGGSTDRLFTLTPNGGTLDGSGASGDGMGFSSTGAIALTGTGNRTLNLIGTETHNSFLPALGDADSNSKTTLVMNGSGRWLWESQLSTYSGDTSILAGTLRLYMNGLLPSGVGKGNVDVNSGGSLISDNSTTINGLNNGSNGSSGTVTISSGTFTIGSGDAAGSFGGVISGTAIAKIGAGTQILSGVNTYTGTTNISGGVLEFGVAGSIGGTGLSVTLANGAAAAAGFAINQSFLSRLTTGSIGSAALALASANNLDFSAATGANLAGVSLGAVGVESFTGVLTPYGTTYRLGGGGGTLTLSNATQLVGSNNLIVSGPGIVASTGSDTYTGTTTVLTGGTFAPVVAVGGMNSGMGVSSNLASNLILDGGSFKGAGMTDRDFTLTANGGTLDNSGALSFTGPGTIALPANTSVTLTLSGSSTAHNLLNLSLADAGSGGVTSVLKTGVGKWTFSADGTKTYSGPTHITSGQLEALSGDAFSHYSDLVIDSSASLEMHDNNVTVNGLQGSGAIYNSFTNGTHTLTIGAQNDGGTWTGVINSAATLNLIKSGTGVETFTGANTYVGTTTVTAGTFTLASTGSLISTAVFVSSGATFNLNGMLPTTAALTTTGITNIGANTGAGILPITLGSVTVNSGGHAILSNATSQSNRTLLIASALTLAGSTDSWLGQLDLGGNDLDVQNASLATLTNQVKQGFNSTGGNGIISSTAAISSTHFTTLGVIQNSVDGTTTGAPLYASGTTLGLFDGASPSDTDVLAKYTYYGDTNLNGSVDSSDYSRIDNGFIKQLTGWFNGDFNYDGVVNGSDYTLIDNTYNLQGAALSSVIASPTASVTTGSAGISSVPEPSMLAVLILAGVRLLGRQRKSRQDHPCFSSSSSCT